jgi:hypothetical protein
MWMAFLGIEVWIQKSRNAEPDAYYIGCTM